MEKFLDTAILDQIRGSMENINDSLYKAIYYLEVCIVASKAEEDRVCPISVILKDIQDLLYKIPEFFEPLTDALNHTMPELSGELNDN